MSIVENVKQDNQNNNVAWAELNKVVGKANSLLDVKITRNINGNKEYTIEYGADKDKIFDLQIQHLICEKIISKLPPILYFDDFKDMYECEFEIKEKRNDAQISYESTNSSNIDMMKVWFQQSYQDRPVDEKQTLDSLFHEDTSENDVKTIQSFLNLHIASMVNNAWARMQNKADDEAPNVRIDITRHNHGNQKSTSITFKFQAIQNNGGAEAVFDLKDRSKGFLWFFMFSYRIRLNPNKRDDTKGIIYLLDEPGCYLHPSGQKSLCENLEKEGLNATLIL